MSFSSIFLCAYHAVSFLCAAELSHKMNVQKRQQHYKHLRWAVRQIKVGKGYKEK